MIRQILLAILLINICASSACINKSEKVKNEFEKPPTGIEELTRKIGDDPANIDLLFWLQLICRLFSTRIHSI